jgi:branched-chain amino acid transport system ATP-binding protein
LAADALLLEDIDAFYGDSHVLQGVTLRLTGGHLLGLLGRNGAGKTTLMSVAAGLLRSKRGRIEVFGQAVAGLPPERIALAGVALVPQGRRIFRSLTVRENLLVAARPPSKDSATAWSVERVFTEFPRLAQRHKHVAAILSGGEQQMLAIGRALVANPRVLLMDEPSEGLSPQIVGEVMTMIRRLKDDGLSIVLVEQNARIALDVADEVVVLNSGRVELACRAAEMVDEAELHQHLGIF